MKLFGYSISLNVIILIGILYLIMVVNALSASCNREGIQTQTQTLDEQLQSIATIKSDIETAKTQNRLTAAQKLTFKNRLLPYARSRGNKIQRAYAEAYMIIK